MEDNDNNTDVKIVAQAARRVRASGPILLLAFLFVVGAFLSWYFSWFGRELSDADVAQYLVDEKHPRRVQHALLQIQQRIERGDGNVKQWYPQVLGFSTHQETEFRLTAAWVMGFDNQSTEFHEALRKLAKNPAPIVRRNAALALVRFNDPAGREELVAVLSPHEVASPIQGDVSSTLKEGSQVTRGTLLGRITSADGRTVEVRSPLPGKIKRILVPGGSRVGAGAALLTINSDEQSIWEALRGLALVGQTEDLPAVERFANDSAQPERIRKQATLTAKTISTRLFSQ